MADHQAPRLRARYRNQGAFRIEMRSWAWGLRGAMVGATTKAVRDDGAPMVEKDQQFVSVTGVIHLHTSIGVSLDVGKRRVFVSQFSYLDFASPLCGR